MKKNVASQNIGVQMITAADGTAFTGTVTVSVTGDAGTQATGSVGAGICTHEGNGYHTYKPAQAETNYDLIAFTFTGTGAIPATIQVFTGFPQTVDNAIGIADIPTVAEFNARTLVSSGYATPTNITAGTITTVTNLTNLPSIPAGWLTAAGIAASALNGKGDWNIGKTGYALTQAFPANFADMSITVTTGQVTVGTNNDKTGYTVSTVSDKTGYSLAQAFPTNFADLAISVTTGNVTVGTNNDKTGYTASTVSDKTGYSISGTKQTLDALNDIAATAIVSAGAITTLAGAVVNVDTVDTCSVNSDMRGTDNAATAASLATAQADLDIITGATGVNLLAATQASIDAIELDTGTTIPGTITTLQSGVTSIKEVTDLGVRGSATSGTLSTTQMTTDLTEVTDGHYIGRLVTFTSGVLIGQQTDITGYTGATKLVTFTTTTDAPGVGDDFIIS